MATGKKAKTKIVKQLRLKNNDVTFDSHGWMVIKNPAIKRLIEQRWLAEGLIPPPNLLCPKPKGPTPPSPDGMCACAFTLIGQERIRLRSGGLRTGNLRTGRRSGTTRTQPR